MLVLASLSPRRSEILKQAGIEFMVRAVPVDESARAGESPAEYVRRLAEAKARAVTAAESETVLGADTTVVVDGEILGKPVDAADARRMLTLIAGRRHDVLTGICLKRGNAVTTDHASTAVWFAKMTREAIDEYVRTGEPMDKAGAYAIQGRASRYVEKIDGCYFNVVGLPIALVWRKLSQ